MKISVIITAYGAPQVLKRVLTGYLNQKQQPHEIIIAEDAEALNLKEIVPSNLKRNQKFVHVTQPDSGYRRSLILNKAIVASEGDYLILTDSDCIPHKHFVKDHASYAKPNQYLLGARSYVKEEVLDDFNTTFFARLSQSLKGNLYPKKVAFRIPFVNWDSNTSALGANMSFWKNDLIEVNGFDNEFIGWGHEDMELLDRLKISGLTEKFLHQQCILYHLNHPILSKSNDLINTERWNESKAQGLKRSKNGLDQFLSSEKDSLIHQTFVH
ncbi:MAG: glycosyltransferase [Verrucomicrobia bacterium]|nr:glycosyltransferase [Verrucomicrobiota bacterium]MDA1067529.1 glycosyltransferase [Verrucomicrobiota bacterium]